MSNPQQTSSKDELAAEDKVEFQLSVQIDPDLIKNFPADVARDFGVLPLGRFGEKSLVLATDEDLSPGRVKELRKRLGGQLVHLVPSSGSEVKALVEGVFDAVAVSLAGFRGVSIGSKRKGSCLRFGKTG